MWNLQPETEYEKLVKKWPKKYRRELEAMLDNLDTFHKALCQGMSLEQIPFGFVHQDEPKGILLIDQKGAGSGVRQTRLYIYPDATMKILHLITVGFKEKHLQRKDIQYATEFVDSLRQQELENNE